MTTTTKPQEKQSSTLSDSPTPESTPEKSSSDPTTSQNGPEESSTGGSLASDEPNESSQQEEENQPETTKREASQQAARYRVQLRDAEAERDAAQAKLDAVVDAVVSEKLQETGVTVKLLRTVGADLHGVFSEDGTFSDEALLALVNGTVEGLGMKPAQTLDGINRTHKSFGKVSWATRGAGYVPSAGTGGELPPKGGWKDVIQGR